MFVLLSMIDATVSEDPIIRRNANWKNEWKSNEKPRSKIPKNQLSKNPENPKKNSNPEKPWILDQSELIRLKNPKSEQDPILRTSHDLKFVPIDGRENVGKVSYKIVEASWRDPGRFFFAFVLSRAYVDPILIFFPGRVVDGWIGALVRVGGYGSIPFELLQIDDRDTAQYKDPDDQIHTIIGNEHGLFGDQSFHGPVGYLFCVEGGFTLGYKSFHHGGMSLYIARIKRIDVLQEEVAYFPGLDMYKGGQ